MIKIIRNLLLKIIEDIDSDNSNISDSEAKEIIEHITFLSNKQEKLSIYQACKYLGLTRPQFDYEVKVGRLPKGRKQVGFKELFYYKSDLEKYKNAK
jgi:predicted DNA-binding transcriptional regulator AlpA